MLRIAAFVIFVLLAVLEVIQWSPRYYALGFLLLLLAVIAAASLVYKRDEKRDFKALWVVLKAVAMTGILLAAALPAIVFPQRKLLEVTGQYQVATAEYAYTDTSRIETYTDTGENRKLNVAFWYPWDYDQSSPGGCPLVVFSHGSMGIKTSNESLYRELASHGYVVCSIDHTYQCLYTTDENGHTKWIDMGFMRELRAEDAKSDRRQSVAYYQKWMAVRTGDIQFTIDQILAEAKKDDAETAYRLIDARKIGVMGHSLGGSAVLGVGRLRDDVGAVMALESPFLCDIEGVEDGEFVWNGATYPAAVLNIYSDSTWSHLDQWPQYAANQALLSDTGANAFNVHISGTGHLGLTDLSLTSPLLTRLLDGRRAEISAEDCLKTINRISLEFFDCYLKGRGEFVSDGVY
ncbi:MAG: alpha/beta hydrolase family protein [Christensenellales bacterium]